MNHGHKKGLVINSRVVRVHVYGSNGEAVIKARRNTYNHAMMGRHP